MNTATEEGRELFNKSKLTYNDIFDNLPILKNHLINKFASYTKSGGMEMTLSKEVSVRFKKETRNVECFFLYVDGSYFKKRELISFNADGFIGFAGWADSKNIQPIMEAFSEFIMDISPIIIHS
jgi:hypothetical protein